MTDTTKAGAAKRREIPANAHPIWLAREKEGLAREKVTPLLDPPVSSKTLERWERGTSPVPVWRIRQLAAIYRVKVATLLEASEAA